MAEKVNMSELYQRLCESKDTKKIENAQKEVATMVPKFIKEFPELNTKYLDEVAKVKNKTEDYEQKLAAFNKAKDELIELLRDLAKA